MRSKITAAKIIMFPFDVWCCFIGFIVFSWMWIIALLIFVVFVGEPLTTLIQTFDDAIAGVIFRMIK